ncbi:uncharacterized protein N7506_007552 [Penicillium brevicompactum]|uniref:uncharacterized protein n=1 Tax=Penicillium brevicompactum TaxID=5074 RepID=UPI0025410F65|nr:uncharacterized protein N7506_007552 [Penicillium brevicompactum]KAJ5333769.1 hypothetical protein N7506_007552 [Penicillium brevicompactum]
MTGLHDDPRERILHAVQRQIEYLRSKPDSRLRVIARLESLHRIAHSHQNAEDRSPLGYLLVNIRKHLPIQIKRLRSDPRNDGKVANALSRMVLGASLFVRCAQSEDDPANIFEQDVEPLSALDLEEDFPLDEDDLTRILFGF